MNLKRYKSDEWLMAGYSPHRKAEYYKITNDSGGLKTEDNRQWMDVEDFPCGKHCLSISKAPMIHKDRVRNLRAEYSYTPGH